MGAGDGLYHWIAVDAGLQNNLSFIWALSQENLSLGLPTK